MTMQLYCFGESGHSYKVALALALTGCDWETRYVDFFNGETRGPAFRALNPMGECPVLVDGDEVLTQSGNILYHIAEKTGQLGGASTAEQKEIWRWVLWDNHKLSSQAGMLRFLMNFLPADKRPAEVIAFTQGRVIARMRSGGQRPQGIITMTLELGAMCGEGYLYILDGAISSDWSPNIALMPDLPKEDRVIWIPSQNVAYNNFFLYLCRG